MLRGVHHHEPRGHRSLAADRRDDRSVRSLHGGAAAGGAGESSLPSLQKKAGLFMLLLFCRAKRQTTTTSTTSCPLLNDSQLSTSIISFYSFRIPDKIHFRSTKFFFLFPLQRPRFDPMGSVWKLLQTAEGGHRAGLHAGADRRAGPAVLPLLHPLAAGQDYRGGSQQGA